MLATVIRRRGTCCQNMLSASSVPVPASHRASAVVGPRGATFYVWVLGAPHVQRWKLWPAWPTRTSFFMRLVQARWPSETL